MYGTETPRAAGSGKQPRCRSSVARAAIAMSLLVVLAGCWNGGNMAVSLGDVSLGQQLIDLKRALEQEAITEAEYQEAKDALLELSTLCGRGGEDDGEADGDDDGIDWF